MNKVASKVIEFLSRDIFTDVDVCALFPGTPHHRYGLIKRALASGDIILIRRGLYILAKKFQRNGLHPFELANLVYGPSYISLESALSYHGWIPEAVYTTTSVSKKKSREFETPLGVYSYRHVPLTIFYLAVDRVVGQDGKAFFVAAPFKALADYIYVNKKNWTSLEPAIESLRLDEQEVSKTSLADLNFLEAYKCQRVVKFIEGVKKELGHEH